MRTLSIIRLGWGVVLLSIPGRLTRVICGLDTVAGRRVLRVLGARHVVQAMASRRVGRAGAELGASVDGAHWLTDVGFAAADKRWRKMAVADSLVTGTFGLASLLIGRHRARQ
jgi:hypothetical protein